MNKAFFLVALLGSLHPRPLSAQKLLPVEIARLNSYQLRVTAGDKPFTTLFFPDTFPKPVLYPIYAADGEVITRGFPLKTRPDEPTDHPHHVGLWLTYENVNGLDFWNNSYAIAGNKKDSYGSITVDSIIQLKSGDHGVIRYNARWVDASKNILLKENTSYVLTATVDSRTIDRITTLTAMQPVEFPDAKDGMLGLRVTHELELPSHEERSYTDNKGNITTVGGNTNTGVTGNYITSEGKTGDDAWGTRGRWCLLYGRKGNDTISIAIIDHPSNPGYPTYWHARGYGLFAANPLGQKVFSNGKETLDFKLQKGQSVTFRYRIVIYSGKRRLMNNEVNKIADDFAGAYLEDYTR